MLSIAKALALSLVLVFSGAVWSQSSGAACVTARDGSTVCPQADAQCRQNRYGDVICSTPGGGIEINNYGDALCGPGNCVKDSHGEIFCSTQSRGAAALDRYGKAVCSDSCVKAQTASCVVPKAAQ